MVNGINHTVASIERIERNRITTAILVLVLLRQNCPRAMTTYELGLWISDNQCPPRPLSVIIKTLASDGYIVRAAAAGKRAGLWTITSRGQESLAAREEKSAAAAAWLIENPSYASEEFAVINSIFARGNQSPKQLADSCGMSISPVRTALKKLMLRGLVLKPGNPMDGYCLTDDGYSIALDHRRPADQKSPCSNIEPSEALDVA